MRPIKLLQVMLACTVGASSSPLSLAHGQDQTTKHKTPEELRELRYLRAPAPRQDPPPQVFGNKHGGILPASRDWAAAFVTIQEHCQLSGREPRITQLAVVSNNSTVVVFECLMP